MILPNIIQAMHGIAGMGDNYAGEKIVLSSKGEIKTASYIGTYNSFQVLIRLLQGSPHTAVDAVGHETQGCHELYGGIGTEISY